LKKRIIGIDVARDLAVIGMIIVNFKVVFEENGLPWVQSFGSVFDGKATATFVVLVIAGLALMINSTIKNKDTAKLKIARNRILRKAFFLFVIGVSYIVI
jgi:predicted acyltransferase